MIIERYSFDGFKPQYQNHHLKSIISIINMDLSSYSAEMKYSLQCVKDNKAKFYAENKELLQRGIWAFIKEHKNNQSLNHVKGIALPKYYAYIPNDTLVIDTNWEYKTIIADERMEIFGCYIPLQSLDKIEYCGRV